MSESTTVHILQAVVLQPIYKNTVLNATTNHGHTNVDIITNKT